MKGYENQRNTMFSLNEVDHLAHESAENFNKA